MPGNEVGDRVHNFFGQDTQSQIHSQVVNGSWSALNNNLWVGNQGQVESPLISSPKNFSIQQSDNERRHASQSSQAPSVTFTQSTLRSSVTLNQPQKQQSNLYGYMHGHQVFQANQNEANLLGMDRQSNQHKLNSRLIFGTEAQQGSGSGHHLGALMRSEHTQSPVKFDFLGGQNQMNSQQFGMMQSFPGQQSGISDMHLLQQQVILMKMQELQRQQAFQQQEVSQSDLLNHLSSVPIDAVSSRSTNIINGIPVQDRPNNMWTPEFMVGNTHCFQHGASSVMQGVELLVSQEQRLQVMGMIPQQVDQSCYGFHVSSTGGSSSQPSYNHLEKPMSQQVSACNTPISGIQHAVTPVQFGTQDGSVVSRLGFQGHNMFRYASAQGLNGEVVEDLQQADAHHTRESTQEVKGSQEQDGLSEALKDKKVTQAAPQNVVPLDPTEEKILFGSDDNIWDAFGSSTTATGGNILSEGMDFQNAIPSMHSGSWSALMQAALAETSSGDIGLRDEWSGLAYPNSQQSSISHQPSTLNDSGKQKLVLFGGNSENAASLKPTARLPDGPSKSNSYCRVPGPQQSGQHNPSLKNDSFLSNSDYRSIQQSSEEGSTWLDHSSQVQTKKRGISSSSNGQKSMSEHQNSMQHCQDNEQRRGMLREKVHIPAPWETRLVNRSTALLENVNSDTENDCLNRQGSVTDFATTFDQSSADRNQGMRQQFANSLQLNNWKHARSLAVSEGVGFAKYQHPLNTGHQMLGSSEHPSTVKIIEMDTSHQAENSSVGFRSNLSHHASSDGQGENVCLDANKASILPDGEKISSDQIGRKSSGPPKFQYHPMGNLDEGVEPYYGAKQVTNSHTIFQQESRGPQDHDQGSFEKSTFAAGFPKSSVEIDKIELPNSHGGTSRLDEVPPRGAFPGSVPNMPVPSDGSDDIYTKNKSSPSSQNMLELLHKVDQSGEHGYRTYTGSTDQNMSTGMAGVETSDRSFSHLQRKQSFASHSFSLQLAPPTSLPIQNQPISSPMSSRTVNLNHVNPESVEKTNIWLAPTVVHSLSCSQETAKVESRNMIAENAQVSINQSDAAVHRNAPAPQFKHINSSRDRVPHDQSAIGLLPDAPGKTPHKNFAFSSDASQPSSINQSDASALTQQIPVLGGKSALEPSKMSSISQQAALPTMLPNTWTTGSRLQHSTDAPKHKSSSSLFSSHFQSNNNFKTSFFTQQKPDDHDIRGDGTSDSGACSVSSQGFHWEGEQSMKGPWQCVSSENADVAHGKMSSSQGKDSVVKHPSDSPLTNTAVTPRDIEAFGRLLKPDTRLHQNYSLLNQLQAIKTTETDPDNRDSKGFKGLESSINMPQLNPSVINASTNNTTILTDDSKLLSFLSEPGDNRDRNALSQQRIILSQDMPTFGRRDPQDHSSSSPLVSIRRDHSQISPQLATSWFGQYGSVKNGQLLSVHDARKAATLKSVEQEFISGESSDSLQTLNQTQQVNTTSDTVQVADVQKKLTPTPMAIEDFPSFKSLPPVVADESLVSMRPKKRKTAVLELCPWHKELMQGDSQKFQSICSGKVDWAKVANRLVEKVEEEAEMIEVGTSVLRPKTRLILTMQLMQLLFPPSPASLLSANASLNYDQMAYVVARASLGDACSLSCLENVHLDNGNILGENRKSCKISADQLMEDLISRASKLENNLLRLDKKPSILDFRMEGQDLEKFSIINRFAKFHGRGQANGAEISLSSDAGYAQKAYPQRYVTALPMPRNLPDSVQCLSL